MNKKCLTTDSHTPPDEKCSFDIFSLCVYEHQENTKKEYANRRRENLTD